MSRSQNPFSVRDFRLASLLSPAVRNLGLEPTVEASSAAAGGLESPVAGVVQAGV